MAVQIEEIEYCKIFAKFTADPSVIKEKRQATLQSLKDQKVKVAGFRNGKAPDLAYKSRFGKYIDDTVTKELVSLAYDEVLFETKMKPIGYPQVSSTSLMDNYFYCELMFFKKPDFELKQYKDFEIPSPVMPQNVNDIFMKQMEDYRRRFALVSTYTADDVVQKGDTLTMDISCMVEGKPVDILTRQSFFYDTDQSDVALLLPELNQQLYGMKLDEQRSFTLKLNSNFGELADKVGEFTVKLNMGIKTRLHAMDDALAVKAGFENLKKMGEDIFGKASSSYQNQKKAMVQEQVIVRLLSNHDFEIPNWLTEVEVKNIARTNKFDLNSLSESDTDKVIETAENRVKLSLVLDSIREAEPASYFSDEELVSGIKNNLINAGNTEEYANTLLENARANGMLLGVISSLRDETTLEWIVSNSKILSE
jgi:trigger factor